MEAENPQAGTLISREMLVAITWVTTEAVGGSDQILEMFSYLPTGFPDRLDVVCEQEESRTAEQPQGWGCHGLNGKVADGACLEERSGIQSARVEFDLFIRHPNDCLINVICRWYFEP